MRRSIFALGVHTLVITYTRWVLFGGGGCIPEAPAASDCAPGAPKNIHLTALELTISTQGDGNVVSITSSRNAARRRSRAFTAFHTTQIRRALLSVNI